MGKGGSSTTTVSVPAKTTQETELDKINLEIAKSQQTQLQRSTALQDPTGTLAANLKGYESLDTPEFRAQLQAAAEQQAKDKQFTDLVQRQLTGRLTGQAFLTPEEQSTLDKMYESSRQRGTEDITQFGNEIAGQRGMRPSDSPVGNEMIREKGRLTLGLESAKAQSSLDLAQGQKMFEESIRQFQEGLRQTAFQNRLALSTTAPLSVNLASTLAGQRFASASTTTTQPFGLGQGLGAAGSVFSGGGNLAYGLGTLFK
jgi:hypothetical protein